MYSGDIAACCLLYDICVISVACCLDRSSLVIVLLIGPILITGRQRQLHPANAASNAGADEGFKMLHSGVSKSASKGTLRLRNTILFMFYMHS